jgi:hypothetical protein
MPPTISEPNAVPPARRPTLSLGPPAARGDYQFEPVVGMLGLAIVGTTLAGVAYPLVIGLVDLAFGMTSAVPTPDGGYLFAFALLGGMVGGLLAFCVSLPVAMFAGAIAWLSRITARDVWFASLVGGWTGYFATHLMLESLRIDFWHWVAIGLAVVVGQIGAGGFVIWTQRRQAVNPVPSDGESELRFGLRQLFGITTAVALLAAFSEALKINQWAHAPTSFAAAIQATIIAIALAVRHARGPQPEPAKDVSREAPTPPA